MNIELAPIEARVIGCLIEKEITTPDQYPLSLNALTNACNQKTNREPVLDLPESAVQQARRFADEEVHGQRPLGGLRRTGHEVQAPLLQYRVRVAEILRAGTRHHLRAAAARPADPGELRSRTNRLCEFADAGAVESALQGLMTREDGPFIARLARAPGARESRYAHLFSGHIESTAPEAEQPAGTGSTSEPHESLALRVARLERLVEQMQARLDALSPADG